MQTFDSIAIAALDVRSPDGGMSAGLSQVRNACEKAATIAVKQAHQIFTRASVRDVVEERVRQECHSAEHDAGHIDGDLAQAAVCYAMPPSLKRWFEGNDVYLWPFEGASWKPTTRRRDLIKAAALILAELDRLDALPEIHHE